MDLLTKVASLIAASGVADVPTPEIENCDCGPGEHDDIVYVGPLSITLEERLIENRSIAGTRSFKRNQYVLETEVPVAGTQWSPPDVDLTEIGAFDTVEDAVVALLSEMVRWRLQNVLTENEHPYADVEAP